MDQCLEHDKIPFGENTDHVLGLACPRPLPTLKNPEIVRPGLDCIPPLAEITVDQELSQKAFDSGIIRKKRVKVEAFHLYPASMEKIAGLFGGQA
jgi:hypothetical protein